MSLSSVFVMEYAHILNWRDNFDTQCVIPSVVIYYQNISFDLLLSIF